MLYVYFFLLVVYFVEFPRMFAPIGTSKSQKIGLFACHGTVSVLSLLALYELYLHSITYFIEFHEYAFLFFVLSFFGAFTGTLSVFVLFKDTKFPKRLF